MSGAAPHPLRLAFPGTGRPSIEFAPRPDGACVVLGRPSAADAPPDVPLQDASVSRRHAEFAVRGGAWHVRSLGKGGTALEGRLLGHEDWVPLPDASTLAVGPYRIRVVVGDARTGAALGETIAFAEATEGPRPEAVSRQRLESAEVRLSALLAAARRIDACDDEQSLADAAVSVLIDTRDFDRAAVVRAGAVGDRDGWVPLAIAASNEPARSLPVSRTLLEEARSTNGMVRLDQSMARMNLSASIMASGATAAICVPIPSAVPPRLFLYADTRGGGALGDAAVPFADMVAQLAGLSLSAAERRALQGEMVQARRIQERLLPASEGECGCVRWALYSRPAAHAAGAAARPSGDFFTVLEADGGRVAAFIGDVAGKGAGAAIVMASSVAHLDAAVRHGLPIEQALSGVSEYFVRRPNLDLSVSTGGFSTAIAVEIMPDGSCRGVDAAHCYAAVVRADGAAERLDFPNRTTMIGYAEGIELVADEFRLAPGDRLVLFSDGVVDQQGRSGKRFCESYETDPEPVLAALRGSRSAQDDVDRLVGALERFAAGTPWSDDVTVASLVLAG
jgi:serine phosphatase RsbU (regulator of sigma subunit)